jgi:anionic cell wall polymer biosynthesis LytR-Cps2A-Psr (LCP) family protein
MILQRNVKDRKGCRAVRGLESKISREIKRRKVFFFVVLLFAAIVFIVGGCLEMRNRTQSRGVILGDIGLYKTMRYQGITYVQKVAVNTYLLMGVDQSAQDTGFGARQGGQADLFLLLVIDHTNRKIYQLQLDRDTMTEVQTYGVLGTKTGTKVMQLCLSHSFGATAAEHNQNAIDAVSGMLNGIPIDYYLTFCLEAIGMINDALGGVTVTLHDDFTAYDPVMTAGKTMCLNAAQAEIFTRFRMEVGDGSNDSRMVRQRAFLSAAVRLFREQAEDQPDFIGELYDELGNLMTTNVSKSQMINDINTAYGYAIQPVEALEGEHTIDDSGFMAFYMEDDAVLQWVLQAYYQPAE